MKKNVFLIAILNLLFFSCSYFSSNSVKEHIYNINELTANFIVLDKDTTSLSSSELFNYLILEDNLNRKFMVLEDGCSNLNTISKGIDVGDTIFITIKLTNPNRLDRDVKNEWYRGPDPESILFVIDGKEVLQIFQSDNLCNHRIILTE